jgi:hypothetical protein
MIKTEHSFYVQKTINGFYSDSEWDGDSFTQNPIYAVKRTEPWGEGRGGKTYTCVKIIITEFNHGNHLDPITVPVQCMPKGVKKIRYKCKCPRCGMSTKTYSAQDGATTRYKLDRLQSTCIIRSWRYAQATEAK